MSLQSTADSHRIEAMKAVPIGQSSNYSPMIAKQFLDEKSTDTMSGKKAGVKTDEEFKKQFKSKAPAKPLNWKDE